MTGAGHEADHRHVVVTGGSTGIGLATGRRFGESGDRVTLLARSESALTEAFADLTQRGIRVEVESGSVGDPGDVSRILESATTKLGPIDVLVNNAGIGTEAPITEMELPDWEELLKTNVTGVFLMTQAVARAMITSGRRGVILFTGSINAIIPKSPAVAYSATKAAVDALVKGLAAELGGFGIRVAGVHPGYIETPILEKVYSDPQAYERWRADRESRVPLGRFGRPEEVAAALFFLASEDASYITGTCLIVDGGRVANS